MVGSAIAKTHLAADATNSNTTKDMKEQFIHVTEKGDRFYYKDREMRTLHREDGPAFESYSGYKEWWFNGEVHREDGPAIEGLNGTKKWWLNNEKLSEEEFNARMKQQ